MGHVICRLDFLCHEISAFQLIKYLKGIGMVEMNNSETKTDVILIGAGIMSATLGSLIKELAPDWSIKVFEQLPKAGEESSNEWNNAGTGHAALCELNYTPEKKDGSIDTTKAVNINEQFQLSKQYWSYLVKNGRIQNPEDFIMPLPHMSFVQGEKDVAYLKKRYEALKDNPLFHGMRFSDDPEQLSEWMPLVMEGRKEGEKLAATKIDSGTDVNFGALTRHMFDDLEEQGVEVHYNHSVKDIYRTNDDRWGIKVINVASGRVEHHDAKFIFIGAGGGSISLLQKTGIPESKHIGGFPVSGLFLVCNNEEIVKKHEAKVYGKAKVGAPPMSVPHLDTRYIDNKKSLLFGPFAGFSPKFLKTGSNMDLFASIKPNNMFTMLSAGVKEFALTRYLVKQVLLSDEKRIEELREFIPTANADDWEVIVAGQRVQVIKDTEESMGNLQFGTEVICAEDGSIAALLGASPGASTAINVMLEVLERCFPEKMDEWHDKIKEMVPSYGMSLTENPELFKEIDEEVSEILGLNKTEESLQTK